MLRLTNLYIYEGVCGVFLTKSVKNTITIKVSNPFNRREQSIKADLARAFT